PPRCSLPMARHGHSERERETDRTPKDPRRSSSPARLRPARCPRESDARATSRAKRADQETPGRTRRGSSKTVSTAIGSGGIATERSRIDEHVIVLRRARHRRDRPIKALDDLLGTDHGELEMVLREPRALGRSERTGRRAAVGPTKRSVLAWRLSRAP